MKRYWVLLICMICLTTSPSFAFGGYSALITPIENSFYGVDYAEEKDEARLQRLEETVYGEAKTGDIKTRLNKLREDISADMIGKEIEARPDTFADDSPKTAYSDSYTDRQTPTEPTVYKEDSSVSYPVVDTMEQIVFKKEYKNSDINNRLTKLEQEVYKQIYPSDDLYTRVDRLKKSLLIEEDKYCNDILIQIVAAEKSLKSLANLMFENHIYRCISDDIKSEEVIDELTSLFKRFND